MIFIDFNLCFVFILFYLFFFLFLFYFLHEETIARFLERGSPRFFTKESPKAANGVQMLRIFTHQRDSSSRRKNI